MTSILIITATTKRKNQKNQKKQQNQTNPRRQHQTRQEMQHFQNLPSHNLVRFSISKTDSNAKSTRKSTELFEHNTQSIESTSATSEQGIILSVKVHAMMVLSEPEIGSDLKSIKTSKP